MGSGDHPDPCPQLAAWNFPAEKLCQRYFPATYLKLFEIEREEAAAIRRKNERENFKCNSTY